MGVSNRHKDAAWTIAVDEYGKASYDGAQLAVLMDIRDELKQVNRLLGCFRVQRALDDLHSLGVATRRKRRKRARRP